VFVPFLNLTGLTGRHVGRVAGFGAIL
jgi:hypothetical protein